MCFLKVNKTFRMVGVLALIVVVGIFYAFQSKNIETPKYKVLKTIDQVEIRVYPPMIVAKTYLNSKENVSSSNNGFRTVANYIFGGNSKQQKIAMTAPVIRAMGDSASLSFVMPSQYKRNELPEPSDGQVQLVEQSSKVLAVLSYGGFSDDEKIKKHANLLRQTLVSNRVEIVGPLLFMGYNAPWDAIDRRNEVAYEVKP